MSTPCESLVVLHIRQLIQKLDKCACRAGLDVQVSELGVPMTRKLYAELTHELQLLQLDTVNTRYAESVDDAAQAFAAIAINNYLDVRLAANPKEYHRNRVTVCRICRLVGIYLREGADIV